MRTAPNELTRLNRRAEAVDATFSANSETDSYSAAYDETRREANWRKWITTIAVISRESDAAEIIFAFGAQVNRSQGKVSPQGYKLEFL